MELLLSILLLIFLFTLPFFASRINFCPYPTSGMRNADYNEYGEEVKIAHHMLKKGCKLYTTITPNGRDNVYKIYNEQFHKISRKKFDTFLRHKKVNKIQIVEEETKYSLILTTNTILFNQVNSNDSSEAFKDANIGAFKIMFDNHLSDWSRIFYANYLRNCRTTRPFIHCLGGDRGRKWMMCYGSNLRYFIDDCVHRKSFFNALYQILDFLESPGKVSEYTHVNDLIRRNKKVKISPKDPRNWFDKDYWEKYNI